jgi:hypothetical protein
LKELRRRLPLMDTALMKKNVLAWLNQFKFPGPTEKISWDDCIREYPVLPEEEELSSGRRLRLAINLYTSSNQYLVSIIECLAPNVRGMYIITVHVNWTKHERRVQRAIDETYKGDFDNGLKARHVLWIQSFEEHGLFSALDACAVAIFGHELTPAMDPEKRRGEPIRFPANTTINIPESTD